MLGNKDKSQFHNWVLVLSICLQRYTREAFQNSAINNTLMYDSAVRLGLGMHITREPSAKLSPRNSAIENATKGQLCETTLDPT